VESVHRQTGQIPFPNAAWRFEIDPETGTEGRELVPIQGSAANFYPGWLPLGPNFTPRR
jgi:hypothetical protein